MVLILANRFKTSRLSKYKVTQYGLPAIRRKRQTSRVSSKNTIYSYMNLIRMAPKPKINFVVCIIFWHNITILTQDTSKKNHTDKLKEICQRD